MTKLVSSRSLVRAGAAVLFTLGFAGSSAAQQALLSMYVDVGQPGSTVDIYVELADHSDMSPWPGGYHADYTLAVSASGSGGSDSYSGSGLGPTWLSIPFVEDDEIAVFADVAFYCSVGGLTFGQLLETVSTFVYRYNYGYSRSVLLNGNVWFVYEALGPLPRACKFPEVYWVQLAPDGRMSTDGVGQGVVGTSRVGCLHVCWAGHTSATDKAGVGAAATGCS